MGRAAHRPGLVRQRPQPRYRDKPSPVAALAVGHGWQAFSEVTWRAGSRGPMRSRFLALRVRPAGIRARRLAQAAATAERGRWDGVLPDATLLAEWPQDTEAPTDYWLFNLPAGPRWPNSSAWLRSAGTSDTTTANASTASAWTTSRDVPGPAGITTSPWSPPPTHSSPNSAWPQKPIQRTHPLPDSRRHPGPAELLDRHLHHVPPAPPCRETHHTKTQTDLTEAEPATKVSLARPGVEEGGTALGSQRLSKNAERSATARAVTS